MCRLVTTIRNYKDIFYLIVAVATAVFIYNDFRELCNQQAEATKGTAAILKVVEARLTAIETAIATGAPIAEAVPVADVQ